MTLNLRMVLQADSAAAKAALDDTARGVKDVTTATEQQTRVSRTSTTAADANTAAKQRNRQATDAMARSHQMAAGATGNLVANFNDIGMMLAAGQNPLQLAIQQGTQITQVIGPMGAAGAARALGSAFVSMLSPINLITLGVIAVSGMMIQWLTAASDEAATLNAELERQKTALEGVVAETERLRLARGMMLSGAQSEDEQIVLEEITRLTEERAAVQERLNSLQEIGGRAAGFADQAAAQRDALTAQLADLDAKIAALNAQRELNAATEEAVDLAGQLQGAANAVVAAIASADGSRLVAAFQAAFPVASQLYGLAQGIIETIGAAQQAAASQDKLDQMAIEFSPGGQAMLRYGGRTPGGTAPQNALGSRNRPVSIGAAGGGGGGGAAAAREEADALQELIDSLEGEIEALRVQDPIQKEMLKHREALAGATEAERAQVEELIAIREREMQQLTAAQELQQFKEDLVENALDGLISKGQSLKEVLDQVIIALAKAVIQAALFGSGPLGSMFGGKGIGALIFGGGMAEGGLVHGPGTGTSDSVPTMLSNGEFVVNANATARNRHLLEAINSNGRVPGYAEGGYVGSDQRRLGGRGAMRDDVRISIDLSGARGDREIEAMARKGTQAALREYDREALPSSVKRVSSDPRRTG